MRLAARPGDEATDTEALVCMYDAWNRLAAVYEDSDSDRAAPTDGGDTLIAEYQYDGLHRRIVKLLPDVENWKRTDYYYNTSWQVIEERYNGSVGDKTTAATQEKARYVWDTRYIDAPVARWYDLNDDDDYGDDNEVLYYANDANMNVTALVNTSGTVVERYQYDAYGQPTVLHGDVDSAGNDTSESEWSERTSNTFENEILFCGYRYCSETGVYDVRYRPYHPTLGRWFTPDHIMQYADGANLHQYAKSNPALLGDPSGTFVEKRSLIGGADADGNFSFQKSKRYFYTCGCGWIDKSHFNWINEYNAVLKQLRAQQETVKLVAKTVTLVTVSEYVNFAAKAQAPVYKGIFTEEGLREAAFLITFLHAVNIEVAQSLGGTVGVVPGVAQSVAGSGWSLEDVPTDYLGVYYAMLRSYAEIDSDYASAAPRDATSFILSWSGCGPVLTEAQAKCLYDAMTTAEKQQKVTFQADLLKKKVTVEPVLFKTHCRTLGYLNCANTPRAHVFDDYGEHAGIMDLLMETYFILPKPVDWHSHPRAVQRSLKRMVK